MNKATWYMFGTPYNVSVYLPSCGGPGGKPMPLERMYRMALATIMIASNSPPMIVEIIACINELVDCLICKEHSGISSAGLSSAS